MECELTRFVMPTQRTDSNGRASDIFVVRITLFYISNHRIVNIEYGTLRTVTTLPEYHIALPGYTPLQTSSSRPTASGSERVTPPTLSYT